MLFTKSTSLPLLILLFSPSKIHSQVAKGPSGPPSSSSYAYQDSAEGLQRLLQEVLAVAKAGNRSKLGSIVSQMEIPNYEAWFAKTFGQETGAGWAGSYGRDLTMEEKGFQEMFLQMAKQEGEISIRKVNDTPDPSRGNEESSIVDSLQRPVDIFFAGWKKRDSASGSPTRSIGYFTFVEGKFRWVCTISVLKIDRPAASGDTASEYVVQTIDGSDNPSGDNGPFLAGVGGVGYPSCDYCPGPAYPRQARTEHAEGMVVLRAIIGSNGQATDIQVVKSPRADFGDEAIKTVRTWRFKPAIGPSGAPVAVIAPIEVTFRLAY
jgi:TonB family protein